MMKYLAVFSLAAALNGSLCRAADFATGQAARLVIGQRIFTAQDSAQALGYTVLGGVGGIAYANGMLFATDANRVNASPLNHRVLIYKNITKQFPGALDKIDANTGRCPVCGGTADVVVGQPDFKTTDLHLSQTGFRVPTSVSSDGKYMVVADTDNNRVLLWNSIPSSNGAPADVVLGQADFKTVKQPPVVDNKSFRGPQGVWIQGTRLYVADTQNNRVLVWNNIPTSNNQPADFVLGQPNFTTAPQSDLTKAKVDAKPTTLLSPVAVSADNTHLFVTDLGHNRILVWNSIPTQTQQPADLAIGQPDVNSAASNNAPALCPVAGKDAMGKDTFPSRCASTLDFPRYALSDGTRLFIADGGNNRVLIYNTIPTQSGRKADIILGQVDEYGDQVSDVEDAFEKNPNKRSSSDTIRTPLSLAFDGLNLYVSDPYDRRILVFTPGENVIPLNGIRNAASIEISSVGSIVFSGTVKENDEVTVAVSGKDYKYKILKDDDFGKVIRALVALINAPPGDPNVIAAANIPINALLLTSKLPGDQGDRIAFAVKLSAMAVIAGQPASGNLAGGQNAANIAPGTIVSILGDNLADQTAEAPRGAKNLPLDLGGVQVYFDGNRAPLLYVSPKQINVQVPFDFSDTTSVSAYVRTTRASGRVTITTPIAVPVVLENPGIFAFTGPGITDPRPAMAYHGSSFGSATVSVDGSIKAGDVATLKIDTRSYTYTVAAGDTLAKVRDALVAAVNANPDETVVASPGGTFTRVRLLAKVKGPAGNGIPISTTVSSGAQLLLTAYTSQTCCASVEGAPITEADPAIPGETILIYATGLGLVQPDEAKAAQTTGQQYDGPALNQPNEPVSSLAGGKTANVLAAGLKVGSIGIYEVQLELNSDIPTNPRTQLTIAQNVYISNIVTIPVFNPNTP